LGLPRGGGVTCSIFICLFLLGAGADFVMMGGMFAGHDQSGKECLISLTIFHFKMPQFKTFQSENKFDLLQVKQSGLFVYILVILLPIF